MSKHTNSTIEPPLPTPNTGSDFVVDSQAGVAFPGTIPEMQQNNSSIVEQLQKTQEIKKSKDHFTDAFALYIIISNLPSYVTVFFLIAFFLATNSKKLLSNILIFVFVPYKYFEHGKILKQDKDEYLNKQNDKRHFSQLSASNRFKHRLIKFSNRIFYENQKKSPIKLIFLFVSELTLGCALYWIKSTFFYFIERYMLAVIASSLIVTNPRSCLKLATTCLVLHHFYMYLFNKIISFNSTDHFETSKLQKFSALSYLDTATSSGTLISHCQLIAKILSLLIAFHIMYYELLVTMNFFKDESKQKSTKNETYVNNYNDVVFNTDVVGNFKYQDIKIRTPVEYNSQTIVLEKLPHDKFNSQSSSSSSSSSLPSNKKPQEEHINDFYEINIIPDSIKDYNCMENKKFGFLKNKMVIKNMENFIYSIFNWDHRPKNKFPHQKDSKFLKNYVLQEGMPPLWKIFTSYKIIRNEGKLLHLQNLNDSIFNDREDIDCKSLVLYNTTSTHESDYHKFNWADFYNSDNSVNLKIEGITVVTYQISETFVKFLIQQPENYTYDNDEMVVLVNGVIWYRVKSQIHPMGELVTVQGLMTSYIYDIQFVIRDHGINKDFLIGDSIIRTSIGNVKSTFGMPNHANSNGSEKTVFDDDTVSYQNDFAESDNLNGVYTQTVEPVDLVRDFSFPSFYHRKFASPIITLKNSVLTTNSNINEEKNKLKKMKKDYSKRFQSTKQEETVLSNKIEKIETSQEEESVRILSKIDNLKKTVQQTEDLSIPSLEKEIVDLENQLALQGNKYETTHGSIDEKYALYKEKEVSLKQEKDQLYTALQNWKSKLSKLQSKNEIATKKLHYLKNEYEVKNENGLKVLEMLEDDNTAFNHYVDFLKNQENEMQVNVRILEQNILRIKNENDTMHKSLERLAL